MRRSKLVQFSRSNKLNKFPFRPDSTGPSDREGNEYKRIDNDFSRRMIHSARRYRDLVHSRVSFQFDKARYYSALQTQSEENRSQSEHEGWRRKERESKEQIKQLNRKMEIVDRLLTDFSAVCKSPTKANAADVRTPSKEIHCTPPRRSWFEGSFSM